MNMYFRIVLLICLAPVLSLPSFAQHAAAETGTPMVPLTLEKARTAALIRSPDLRKYDLAVTQAALVKRAQDYASLPDLSATGSAAYDTADSSSGDLSATTGVSASTTLFDGGKNTALSKKYSLATEAARENLRAERISIIDSVDTAFFAVLEDKASLDAAQSDLDAAKLRLEIAQVKAEAGALARSDLLQTESEIASCQATLNTAKKTLSSAKAKLASLTGLPPSTILVPADFTAYDRLIGKLGTMDDTGLEDLVASVVSIARTRSPDLAVYSLTASQARQSLSAAKSACLPSVSASAAGNLSAGSGSRSTSGCLTLAASMDLDFWTLKNAIDQARTTLEQADLDTAAQGESLKLNIEQAVYSWISSALAIAPSATAFEYAKTNYQNVLEKFKLSSATSSDLSTAQALVSTDETALISARYAFLTSLSTLRGLAGLEDEAEIIAAVK